MKNFFKATKGIPAILGAMLLISILVNVYLYNQLSTINKDFVNTQSELSNVQAEYKTAASSN